MADIIEGFIPADKFEPAIAPASPVLSANEFIPADQFESHEDAFGTPIQQAKAGLEGLAEGIAGPLAPLVETKVLGVDPEDIKGRAEANPITHGAAEAAGLGLGLITGTGEAAVMTKAGKLAQEAAGLANLAKDASYGARVGASAVQQAAEMAVLQSGDEVSKRILQDPNTSAESAISNIGLASALGAGGGAFLTGVVSPLWSATAGPKIEQLLNGITEHINGTGALVPEQTEKALKDLNIVPDSVVKSGLSSNSKAIEAFNILREGQNKEVLASIDKLNKEAGESVMNSLRIVPEDVAVQSENEAGHELLDTFKKEYQAKYGPLAERLDRRDAEAALIELTDEAKLGQYSRLMEKAITDVGADSPYYKLYEEYANRLLPVDNIGKLDRLNTEINNRIKGLRIGGDHNVINALSDVRNSLNEFKEAQIVKLGESAERLGMEAAPEQAQNLIASRAAVNQDYANFAKMSNELSSNLGIGKFYGEGALRSKLTHQLSPEEVLRKFSVKGNADFIPFLAQHFPETLSKVQETELKKLLKPAILSAKGDMPINIKKLADIVDKGMAGQKEYIEALLSPEALQKIQAAKYLHDIMPNPRSSGTAGWMTKMFKDMPRSALAGVAMLSGQNPLIGGLVGETTQLLGRTIPDSVRLSYLKFLGSSQPVKSEGFKAMADFFHNTYKGENFINKAVQSLFKSPSQVLTVSQMPTQKDRDRLEKSLDKIQTDPNSLIQAQIASNVGHYLPAHQAALAQSATTAAQYLNSIKPRPFKPGPLDKEIQPAKEAMARYNRALDIAQQPAVVLQHIKNGTLLLSDVQDLNAMYPGLYNVMASKITNQLASAQADEEPVPYKMRMSMSLFLAQPLDSSMQPASILAAQPKAKQGMPMQDQQGEKQKGRPSALKDKGPRAYQTATQQAERDRSSRD